MNINPSLTTEPSAAKRRLAVKDAVLRAIADGSFTYTEALLVDEPLRSDIFEVLDGVVVEATRSMSGHGEPLMLGTVKLCHVAPDGVIAHPVFKTARVPGTDREIHSKGMKSFGNVADVPDMVPHRIARMILFREGWPIRQMRERSSVVGTVVEWRWLEKEIKGGNALPEVVDLYNEIVTRPSFTGEGAKPDTTNTKSKTPGQPRAGA